MSIILSPEMTQAVLNVMRELKSLEKTSRNEHGRYNFAPVDDFYDAVHLLLPKHGLLITSTEVESELFPMENATYDKNGNVLSKKVSVWVKSTWEFKLHHNGTTSEPYRRFVWVPTAGPQTAGIVQSYASKNFMRELFKIRTGEYELDDMAPEPHGTPVKETASKKNVDATPHDPETGEVKEEPRIVATRWLERVLAKDIQYDEFDTLWVNISMDRKNGNIEEKHSDILDKVIKARKAIMASKTLADIDNARIAFDSVPLGFRKVKNGIDLLSILNEKQAEINATQVNA